MVDVTKTRLTSSLSSAQLSRDSKGARDDIRGGYERDLGFRSDDGDRKAEGAGSRYVKRPPLRETRVIVESRRSRGGIRRTAGGKGKKNHK